MASRGVKPHPFQYADEMQEMGYYGGKEIDMEAVRKIVEADTLARLFTLPATFAHRRIEIVMSPMEDKKVDIERFLCGAVPWSRATDEEMEAGYRAMATDEEYEHEAKEWIEGMRREIT
jgi:hypothetical protein